MSIPLKGAGPGASAAFAQMLYDEFTDTNGVLLQNHTPDVGGPWVNIAGDFDIQETHASAKTLPGGYAFVNVVLPRKAKTSSFNWRNVNDFAHLRTCFRIQDNDNYFYVDYFTNQNVIKLYKKIATSSTQLDTSAQTIANTTWYSGWIDITGNLIEVYHAAWGDPPTKPGSPILSATEAALAAAKGVGMYGANAGQWWEKMNVWG